MTLKSAAQLFDCLLFAASLCTDLRVDIAAKQDRQESRHEAAATMDCDGSLGASSEMLRFGS